MRKNIDIPEETLKDLRIICANINVPLKPYIEAVIITHVELNKLTILNEKP